jgi:putative inorganic carbon (hco3(-)) transporter
MQTALLFISFTCVLYLLAFLKGPIWALLAYANVYFNTPDPHYNWWATYLPFHNWSQISTIVLLLSMVIHRDKLSARRLKSVNIVFVFLILTYVITYTTAQFPKAAHTYAEMLLSFTVISYCIVRVVKTDKQFRALWISILCFAGYLSLNAYIYGTRINSRLENIGPSDSHGSNEFALLLSAVIPFVIPFILKGTRKERIVSIFCLPFLLNAFVLCNSRGAVVALIVAIFISILVVTDKKTRITMLAVTVLLGVGVSYLADQEMLDRMATLLHTSEAMSDEEQANELSSGRMAIWGYGLEMVKDYPFGAGPNGFKKMARFYMPKEILTFYPGADLGVRSAHNSYLQVLVEQGYVGLFLYLFLCGYTLFLIYMSFLKIKDNPNIDSFWRYCVFGIAVSFWSIILGSLFNSRVYYEFFWWQIAMTVVLASLVNVFVGTNAKPVNE